MLEAPRFIETKHADLMALSPESLILRLRGGEGDKEALAWVLWAKMGPVANRLIGALLRGRDLDNRPNREDLLGRAYWRLVGPVAERFDPQHEPGRVEPYFKGAIRHDFSAGMRETYDQRIVDAPLDMDGARPCPGTGESRSICPGFLEELHEYILRCVSQLESERERSCLLMRLSTDLTSAIIGQVLGYSEANVRKAVQLGKEHIRESVSTYLQEHPRSGP